MHALAQVTPARSMNFVNGDWAESSSTRVVERRNPANFDDLIGMVKGFIANKDTQVGMDHLRERMRIDQSVKNSCCWGEDLISC